MIIRQTNNNRMSINLPCHLNLFLLLLILLINNSIIFVNSCEYLQIVDHPRFGNIYFQQLPLDSYELKTSNIPETGRPSYVSIDNDGKYKQKLYLLHINNPQSGEGRWIFSKEFSQLGTSFDEEDTIIGYLRSWAILPYLYHSSQDSIISTPWYFVTENNKDYMADSSFTITCFNDVDKTIFIQIDTMMTPRIDGYYVERFLTSSRSSSSNSDSNSDNNNSNSKGRSVYSQIKFIENDRQIYLYRMMMNDETSSRWLIGFEYYVDSAYAFVEDSTDQAVTISNQWNILDHYSWRKEESMEVISVLKYTQSYEFFSPTVQELPDILRQIRNILPSERKLKKQQKMYELRHSIYMPMIGLGTGGIYHEESEKIFQQAIELGYCLFDSAREYGNEYILGNIIKENTINNNNNHNRNEFFLTSKVWPTELGFIPTMNAIINSLNDFQTSYIDLYLLHWPECDHRVDWMHCETTVDPKGTWRESWYALEKAYSEGRVLSIGFSNVNIPILTELKEEIATILPHVIQNWSELGNLDYEVRQWCENHDVIYQPYATIRNIRFQPPALRQQVDRIARHHNVTEYDVNLRFFLQTGASIIPRATKQHHLRNNLHKTYSWSLSDEEMKDLGWKLTIHNPIISNEEL